MNLSHIVIAIVIVIIITILILSFLEKRAKRVLEERKAIKKSESYKEELERILDSKKDKKTKVENVNSLSQKFFKEFYNIENNVDYTELYEVFRDKRNLAGMKFSENMINLFYSPKEITNKDLEELERNFKKIVENNSKKIARMKVKERKGLIYKIPLKIDKASLEEKEEEKKKEEKIKRKNNPLYEKISEIKREMKYTEYKFKRIPKSYFSNKEITENPSFIPVIEEYIKIFNKNLKEFNEIIKKIYLELDFKNKNKLKQKIENWQNERISLKEKNTLEKIKCEIELMNQYLIKIEEIIK